MAAKLKVKVPKPGILSKGSEAFIWVWLPGAVDPIIAGKAMVLEDRIVFSYGRSYLKNPEALSLNEAELPLAQGTLFLGAHLQMPGCLRDAAPDAWGRKLLLQWTPNQFDSWDFAKQELYFWLHSGSDRIGNLDFQQSATVYEPRNVEVSLEEMLQAVGALELGKPLNQDLCAALCHGTSVGGARPKVLVTEREHKAIAKFSCSDDPYPMIKLEYIAMKLAKLAGLHVAEVELRWVGGRDTLLVRRFDRAFVSSPEGSRWIRKGFLSALTLLNLDELFARYASYPALAGVIRERFLEPKKDLIELFKRLIFNILVSNSDDHARNHGALIEVVQSKSGSQTGLVLSPAYDVCPQLRSGTEMNQAMLINNSEGHQNSRSQIQGVLDGLGAYGLDQRTAKSIIKTQVQAIAEHFEDLCDQAQLPRPFCQYARQRLFCPEYAFEGLDQGWNQLLQAVHEFKSKGDKR